MQLNYIDAENDEGGEREVTFEDGKTETQFMFIKQVSFNRSYQSGCYVSSPTIVTVANLDQQTEPIR